MLDLLVWLLLVLAWVPPLVMLHEAGHALAAVALTDGEVSIDLHAAGLAGGVVSYEPERLRRRRAEAWIAAAGPAASLAGALVLAIAWSAAGSGFAGTVLGVGALVATGHFLVSALPVRYGLGVGAASTDSDGRAIWRMLTGAPLFGAGALLERSDARR